MTKYKWANITAFPKEYCKASLTTFHCDAGKIEQNLCHSLTLVHPSHLQRPCVQILFQYY